jgi:hypothetical protein
MAASQPPQPPQRPTGKLPALTPAPGARTTGQHPALTPSPSPRVAAASSPAGQAAMAFLGAIAKASRAFTLYDPANAVIRNFLADYRGKAEAATSEGALVLAIHPFQILRGDEVVYAEEDRERSLSFRLFRDGLRVVSFEPGVAWEELLRFLEILAVRFTGVRQQEDDSVTLLRKAEFQGIGFQAVEGFVPQEDNPEPEEERTAHVAAGIEAVAPADFDTPFPPLPKPAPIAFAAIPPEALAQLQAAEKPDAFGRTALGAAAVVLREAAQGSLTAGDARDFLAEARDFFLADGAVAALADLADLAAGQPPGRLRDEVLRALGDPRLLELLLGQLGDGPKLPPAALRLVPLVSAGSVLDHLAGEKAPGRRALLLEIVEARLPAEAATVIERLGALEAATAKGLARAVVARAPDKGAAVLLALLEHADDGLKVSALEGLLTAKGEVPTARILPLLRAQAEGVRTAAAHLLERRGEADAFQSLEEALTGRKGIPRAEADALARALAAVHPQRAQALFAQWIARKKGLLAKAFAGGGGEETLRWAAVSGLGAIPGAAPVALIEEASAEGDEALKHHCHAVLARRRHDEAKGGRHDEPKGSRQNEPKGGRNG